MHFHEQSYSACSSGTCVEVEWFSACGNATCVEVHTVADTDLVMLRDAINPEHCALIPIESWRKFLADVKDGKFDNVAP